LLLHNFCNCGFDTTRIGIFVNRVAGLSRYQKIGKIVRPLEAAGMGRKDPIRAALHSLSLGPSSAERLRLVASFEPARGLILPLWIETKRVLSIHRANCIPG
jgi:hypothetical protein